jgi:hypothetical protein
MSFYPIMTTRVSPDTPASDILSEEEWKVLFVTFNPINKIPNKSPSTSQVITWIVQLGRFMARKNNGHPGITHI